MPRMTKRYKDDFKAVPAEPVALDEALKIVKNFKKTKFDQSVELCLFLGIDDKQADQKLRGSLSLPHGIGKTKRVICFCGPEKVEEAKAAGAVEAGGDDLIKKIKDGWLDFDVAVAEPPMMKNVAQVARVLGPKGLMPSPKSGTVTPNIAEAIKEYAAGKVEYRNDAGGNLHVIVGKMSFDEKQLQENAEAFIEHVNKIKPSAVKGVYVKKMTVAGTMTPGVPVTV